MAKIIKIQLIQSLILNSVKNETYQSGQFTKADNDKAVTAAYHESAGDEQYHQRMLSRSMFTQAEKLKTWFSEYLTGPGNTVEDPLVSSEEKDDTITILLRVSDRFVMGYAKTLARLGQKYVEDRMIHLWWAPVDEKKSVYYARLAEEDLEGLRRCFGKSAPEAPSYCFPERIDLTFPILNPHATVPAGSADGVVPVDTLMSYPYVIAVGDETEITYTISTESGKKPTDDIMVRADDGCCMPCLDALGRWQVRGIMPGISVITLFSRHDDQVFTRFALRVIRGQS